MHYTPYNLVRFYVGEISGTTPQTVKIYTTDLATFEEVQVSEVNKWYTYLLPKDKGLFEIVGDSVKKVVVKADIVTEEGEIIIPSSTVEASFKGSNTSKVTDMNGMFGNCIDITSLDVSSFDTSNVTNMDSMFYNCRSLTSLDLSKWNTSKVTNMNNMFNGCSGLTSLDLSKWDISEGTTITNMFEGCSNSLTIRMKGCSEDTINKVTSVKPSGASISTE